MTFLRRYLAHVADQSLDFCLVDNSQTLTLINLFMEETVRSRDLELEHFLSDCLECGLTLERNLVFETDNRWWPDLDKGPPVEGPLQNVEAWLKLVAKFNRSKINGTF